MKEKPTRKKRIVKLTIVLIIIAGSLSFVPWDILSVWIAPLPDTVGEQVDDATHHGLDGIIVYVDKAGQPPAFYAAGWKNRQQQVPADPHALFKIASISKLYIAAAATKLVHDQTLSLDKSLAEYLPEFADRIENSQEITLRLMLQHRSGIPNFTDDPDFPWDSPPKDNLSTLEMVLDLPADFNPDGSYSYSNTNYLLIGQIMDKTLGYSHHQYINEEILDPLGLKNTYSLLSEVDAEKVVSGYHIGYEPDIKLNDFISPGGSMVATAADVGTFLRALNDGSLLNKEEQAIYSSVYKYGHTGLLPGYQSFAHYHKDIDAVVVQFVNTSGGHAWNKSEIIYNRIVKILKKD